MVIGKYLDPKDQEVALKASFILTIEPSTNISMWFPEPASNSTDNVIIVE